jgi:hypothetical protein
MRRRSSAMTAHWRRLSVVDADGRTETLAKASGLQNESAAAGGRKVLPKDRVEGGVNLST